MHSRGRLSGGLNDQLREFEPLYGSCMPVLDRPHYSSQALGVPMERLAFVIHNFGVILASISPVSSWAGLQIGYVAGVLKSIGRG